MLEGSTGKGISCAAVMLQTYSEQLESEWKFISQAPVSFIAGVLLAAGIVWAVLFFLFRNRFDGVRESLEHMTSQKEMYKERLEVEKANTAELIDRLNLLTTQPAPTAPPSAPTIQFWMKDWLDLRYRFEQTKGTGLFYVSAVWFLSGNEEDWSIEGGGPGIDKLDVEVLCRQAGMMLTHSPLRNLPEAVASEADHLRRWLKFIANREPLTLRGTGGSRMKGQDEVRSKGGQIEDLISASIRACTDSATASVET